MEKTKRGSWFRRRGWYMINLVIEFFRENLSQILVVSSGIIAALVIMAVSGLFFILITASILSIQKAKD